MQLQLGDTFTDEAGTWVNKRLGFQALPSEHLVGVWMNLNDRR